MICVDNSPGHMHDEGYVKCDEAASNGRTSTTFAVRIPDDQARKLRHIVDTSPIGHESIGKYIEWLIETQALRARGGQVERDEEAEA